MKEISIVLCLWALSSCAPKLAPTEPKTLNASIINGVKVKETDALAASVVGVMNVRSNYICTGTLIAPNVVLTAAHCAPERASNVKIIFGLDVDNIMNSLEPDIKDTYMLTATDFKTGPTWDPKDEVKEIDTGDIALVSFKGTIPTGFKPAKFLGDSNLIKIGNMVTLAGFGVDDVDTSKQINPKKFRDLEEAIANGEVVCDDEANGDHIKCYKVEMTGDGVLRTTKAPIQFIHETEVRLNEQKAGTCSGDSGGPAFMEVNGEFLLWGVTSRGSGLCNEVGVYTNALYYKKWIDETIPTLK